MTTERITVCGVAVDAFRVSDLHNEMRQARDDGRRIQVLHVNAHAINLTFSDPEFRDCFKDADLVMCDGEGVRIAARMAGHELPERITYADWFWEFAEFAAKHAMTLFLLGGQPGRAEAAAAALKRASPALSIVGTHHGYFDRSAESPENAAVLAKISESNAQVLLVCFGMPIQEKWLNQYWSSLACNVGLCGGAALDYLSGAVKRPPRLVRTFRSEWLGRLAIEPRRLWRRYLLGNPLFLWRALRCAYNDRFVRR